MVKKKSGSSAPEKQTSKKQKPTTASSIDYSDIPASTEKELREAFQDREQKRIQAKLSPKSPIPPR